MTQNREVTCYLQLEPRFSQYTDRHGNPWLTKVSATGITSKRSTRKMPSGAIEVKLTLRIPESVFHPLRPEFVVEVPESAVHQIEVEVVED